MRSTSSYYLKSILSRNQLPLGRMLPSNLATPFRYSHSFAHSQVKKRPAAQQETMGGETAESHGIDHIVNNGHKISVTQLGTAYGSPRKFSTWVRWLLGSIVVIIFPYWQTKWQNFLRIEGEIEAVAEKVEGAVEVVEKVAAVAEEVSEEVAESLPSEGKLKDAVLFVKHVSEEAKKEAELALKLIHEVAEAKEDAETIMEPIIHQERKD
ncbi:uncharacterized protein LOC116259199 [Nymphaea colorata]|nr:uncharacterized protein LOC116259199 [Nymphaea colorata]